MDTEDFNKWSVKDLKEYLLQYDIIEDDIEGSGKNGRIIKADLVRTADNLNLKKISPVPKSKDIILSKKSTSKKSSSVKSVSKKSSTAGLKSGDMIYYDDGRHQFKATVIDVTSNQKAKIRPHIYTDHYDPKYIYNDYRKYMEIIPQYYQKEDKETTITGVEDADIQIMYQVDDLYTFCYTNKKLFNICMKDKNLKTKFLYQQKVHERLNKLFQYLDNHNNINIKVDWLFRPISYNRTGNIMVDGIFFIRNNNNYYYITSYPYEVDNDNILKKLSKKELYELLFDIINNHFNVKIYHFDISIQKPPFF